MSGIEKVKDLLLSVAAVQAHRTADAVIDSDLDSGYIMETIEAGDSQWEITTYVWRDAGRVSIDIEMAGAVVQDIPGPIQALMVSQQSERIHFELPLEWLPKSAESIG